MQCNGPLLIACNHPNSFLDAIIIATLFDKPIYSLTRGDTFKKKWHAALLNSLNMLPVYRMSEGAENLNENYNTFAKCKKIFKQNGIVLIFSEGLCINEWKLRPLKKGTARLSINSWEENIDVKIIPAAINYQSFTSFGKNIQLNFGNIITKNDIQLTNGHGNSIHEFNHALKQELKKCIIEADHENVHLIRNQFEIKQSFLKRILLFLPGMAGMILHAPLFIPVQQLSWHKAKPFCHYDSVMVGLLFILYPFYLLLGGWLLHYLFGGYWWLLIWMMPVLAWCYVQGKKQF